MRTSGVDQDDLLHDMTDDLYAVLTHGSSHGSPHGSSHRNEETRFIVSNDTVDFTGTQVHGNIVS